MSATTDHARLAEEKAGNVVRAVAVTTGSAAVVAGLVAVARWTSVEVSGELLRGMVAIMALLQLWAGFLWVCWFRELYAATRVAGVARFQARGMWWWAWVVPIASAFLGKMMVNDVWWAPDDGRAPIPWRIQLWWGLWVTGDVVGLPPQRRGSLWPLVPIVAFVLAGVVACRVVPLLTDRALSLGARRDAETREPVLAG